MVWAGASSETLAGVVTFAIGSVNCLFRLPLSQAGWAFSVLFCFVFLFKRILERLQLKVLNVLMQ